MKVTDVMVTDGLADEEESAIEEGSAHGIVRQSVQPDLAVVPNHQRLGL